LHSWSTGVNRDGRQKAMRTHTQAVKDGAVEQPSFREVVAYLRGVADAVHTVRKGASSVWPSGAISDGDGDTYDAARPSTRLTLRFGEAAFELDGAVVYPKRLAAFRVLPARGGTRLFEADGAEGALVESGRGALRCTLPYTARALSVVPLPTGGSTQRPSDPLTSPGTSEAYSALALSLVPLAHSLASCWPEKGDERTSAVRLRCAPLSPELYALTGTDENWER